MTRDLFEDSAFLQDGALLDRLFSDKLQGTADALLAEGWKWAEAVKDSHVSYEVATRLHRLYPIEGELTEEQAARYDELAELAQADVLGEDAEAEFEALQAILDGDFTADHAGQLRIEGAYLHPDDANAAIEAGILTGHAAEAVSKKADVAPKSLSKFQGGNQVSGLGNVSSGNKSAIKRCHPSDHQLLSSLISQGRNQAG